MTALKNPVFEYEIFLDVFEMYDEEDSDVLSITVVAETASIAKQKADEELMSGEYNHLLVGRNYRIWDVTEEDRLDQVG